MRLHFNSACLLAFVLLLSGCSTFEKAKRTDRLEHKLTNLRFELKGREADIVRLKKEREQDISLLEQKNKETESLLAEMDRENEKMKELLESNKIEFRKMLQDTKIETQQLVFEKEQEVARLLEEKKEKISNLEQAKLDLEQSLSKELNNYKAKLEMTERGLVLTFLAEIFFDSGRAVVREDAEPTLKKVADVLNSDVLSSKVAIEGHTDNEPIQRSGWKSNWELSSSRALAVLHYFVEKGQVSPDRLSAVGYGEFVPIASNATPTGKQENRRVEIVILPSLQKTGK